MYLISIRASLWHLLHDGRHTWKKNMGMPLVTAKFRETHPSGNSCSGKPGVCDRIDNLVVLV